jgi:hypothetical protein
VALFHQVAVPAQQGVRAHQQVEAAEGLKGQWGEERGEECPVLAGELRPPLAELPLQDGDLVA